MILKGVYDLDENTFLDIEASTLLKGATVARVTTGYDGDLSTLSLRLADGAHLLDIDGADNGDLSLTRYDEGGPYDTETHGRICVIGGDAP